MVSRIAVIRLGTGGEPIGQVYIEYGRSVADTAATIARVELFLVLGVLAGTVLALLAGMALARRAMAPIAQLTTTAAQIARTRDPSLHVPASEADDEVSELARTLEGMLRELDAARAEIEDLLTRQRQFVADASHELRTPLTSVLANLELLADSLQATRATPRVLRCAPHSACAGSSPTCCCSRAPTSGASFPANRAISPRLSSKRRVSSARSAPSTTSSLDVHARGRQRLARRAAPVAINLLENALRHTPPGTEIRVSTVG